MMSSEGGREGGALITCLLLSLSSSCWSHHHSVCLATNDAIPPFHAIVRCLRCRHRREQGRLASQCHSRNMQTETFSLTATVQLTQDFMSEPDLPYLPPHLCSMLSVTSEGYQVVGSKEQTQPLSCSSGSCDFQGGMERSKHAKLYIVEHDPLFRVYLSQQNRPPELSPTIKNKEQRASRK